MAQSSLKKRSGKLSARPPATQRKNKPATKGSAPKRLAAAKTAQLKKKLQGAASRRIEQDLAQKVRKEGSNLTIVQPAPLPAQNSKKDKGK